MRLINRISQTRNLYKNWLPVSFNIYRHRGKQKEIKVILKDGISCNVDRHDAYILARYYDVLPNIELSVDNLSRGLVTLKREKENGFRNIDLPINVLQILYELREKEMIQFDREFYGLMEKGILKFRYKNKPITLKIIKHGHSNGPVVEVFVEEAYKSLNLNSAIVVDVGANIGDSSIYFVLNNAKRVISLEPYPFSYDMLLENITINRVDKEVIAFNAAYGIDGLVKVSDGITNGSTPLIEGGNKEVRLMSLQTIISENNIPINETLCLKMDCEGGEASLLKESISVLKRFDRMLIEYHDKYQGTLHIRIKEKLEMAGFETMFTGPFKTENSLNMGGKMQTGIIFAEKAEGIN